MVAGTAATPPDLGSRVRLQRYQEWSYRVGLAGIVVVALLFGLRVAQRPNHIGEVRSGGTTSTIPGDGNPTSTTAVAAVPFSIVSPADGAHVAGALLTIVGVGDAGDKITWGTVTTTVDSNRTWVLNIGLQPGANELTITASDNSGQSSSLTITVYLDASDTTTSGTPLQTPTSSGPARTTTTRKCAAAVEAGYLPFETTTTESHGSTTTTTVESTTTTTVAGSTTTTVSHGSTTSTTAAQTTTTRQGC